MGEYIDGTLNAFYDVRIAQECIKVKFIDLNVSIVNFNGNSYLIVLFQKFKECIHLRCCEFIFMMQCLYPYVKSQFRHIQHTKVAPFYIVFDQVIRQKCDTAAFFCQLQGTHGVPDIEGGFDDMTENFCMFIRQFREREMKSFFSL